jgi:hypothetical protein
MLFQSEKNRSVIYQRSGHYNRSGAVPIGTVLYRYTVPYLMIEGIQFVVICFKFFKVQILVIKSSN